MAGQKRLASGSYYIIWPPGCQKRGPDGRYGNLPYGVACVGRLSIAAICLVANGRYGNLPYVIASVAEFVVYARVLAFRGAWRYNGLGGRSPYQEEMVRIWL